MKAQLLFLILSLSSLSFAECSGGCNTNPSGYNPITIPQPTYSNLQDVKSGGSFAQAQEAIKQCRTTYDNCVAPGPEMIEGCAMAMADCINRAQGTLPQP